MTDKEPHVEELHLEIAKLKAQNKEMIKENKKLKAEVDEAQHLLNFSEVTMNTKSWAEVLSEEEIDFIVASKIASEMFNSFLTVEYHSITQMVAMVGTYLYIDKDELDEEEEEIIEEQFSDLSDNLKHMLNLGIRAKDNIDSALEIFMQIYQQEKNNNTFDFL